MRRWPLLIALLLAFATGAPLLVGDGVDVPDDALYYELASWEWLRLAWQQDLSPWFVPGKLGGVSLFVDTVPMGPLYPAVALLAFLPAGTALPLAALLHALGTLLTVRWFARTLGASPDAATLAGAAVAVGPLGTFGFVDARGIAWATLLWLPVALGAFERARQADGRRGRWLALCGLALAMILLGSHLRIAAGALAIFCLWALSSGRGAVWAGPPLLAGLLAGAPGVLPVLAEWGQASDRAGLAEKLATLATPPESGLTLASLPGLLAPRPWPSFADYSVGAVLGLALILTAGRGPLALRRPAGRAAALAGVLLLVALSPALGPLRWLFAPLLVLSHPVNDVYSALAMIPAAAAAALAFDALTAGPPRSGPPARSGAPRPAAPMPPLRVAGALALLAGGAVVLTTSPEAYRDAAGARLHALALLQGAVALPLALLLFRRGQRPALILLALVELGAVALRLHTAVPAEPLPLHHRTDVDGVEALAGGYLDVDDLARLEAFRYDAEDGDEGEREAGGEDEAPEEPAEFWEDTAEHMQAEILQRRWPAHLGMARGYRGLSGRAKLIPRRQVAALAPLARQLQGQSLGSEELRGLFEDRGATGARALALFGVPVAASPDGTLLRAPQLVPPCFVAQDARFIADARERVEAIYDPGWWPEHAAVVLEDPARVGLAGGRAELECQGLGAHVVAQDPAMIVFRDRHHPGWRVRAGGQNLETFPVDVVHLGVIVPPGEHRLERRFQPPGLRRGLVAAALGWALLLALAGGWPRRIPRPPPSSGRSPVPNRRGG